MSKDQARLLRRLAAAAGYKASSRRNSDWWVLVRVAPGARWGSIQGTLQAAAGLVLAELSAVVRAA